MILPLSLEPSPPESTDHVSREEFFQAFNEFSTKVQHRIFKLERLQNYVEEDNASWSEFQNGNIQHSLELMRTIRAAEAQYDIEFFRRGLQFLRVRAVECPLSPYVEWELQSHAISAQYGETILVANLTDVQRGGVLWNTRDFLLFDSFAVLVHDYDSVGSLCGGWVCLDKAFVEHCADIAAKFTAMSLPLAVFMADHQPHFEISRPL